MGQIVALENAYMKAEIQTCGGAPVGLYAKKTGIEYMIPRPMPNQFPVTGRLFEKKYTWKGQEYHIEMHGFLRTSELKIVSCKSDSLVLMMTDSEETRACYPFSFVFCIYYDLTEDGLKIRFQVTNRSEEALYCSMGGHPGFRVPLEEGLAFEDYEVSFDSPCQPQLIGFSDAVLCTGEKEAYPLAEERKLPLTHALFARDALVFENTPGSIAISSPKGSHGLALDYPDYPYIGIWQPNKNDPQFLCLEPWSACPGREGITEDLATMPGLSRVEPGHVLEKSWAIRVW